jgi:hypothetical protein
MQTKSHINKGLIIAAILICFNAISHFTKIYFDEWTTLAFAVIVIVGIIVSIHFFSKELNYNTTFGSLFTYGFKTAAVITCVYFVYTILALYVFFPGIIEEKFNNGIEEAKKQGAFDEKALKENMEAGMTIGKKIVTYTYIAGSLMATLFLGVIAALIGAAVIKKNPQQLN